MPYEETIMYGDELQSSIDELVSEINVLCGQRDLLLEQLDNEEVDKVELMARLQAIDALLSVDHKSVSEMYAELKAVDAEIGQMLSEGDGDID